MLIEKTKTLVAGDPKDRATFIGPMISEKEAARLDGWIQDAIADGAKLLTGGKRDGAMLEATLLENVDRGAKAYREEARSEEHTSELQSLMRISYAVFCLKKKKQTPH